MKTSRLIFFFIIITSCLSINGMNLMAATSLSEDASKLITKSFKEKQKVVSELFESHKDDEQLLFLFKKLLAGELFYRKSDKVLVYLLEEDEDKETYKTAYLFANSSNPAGTPVGEQSQYDFKKVKTNNKLRGLIKNGLSQFNLFSEDAKVRLEAAQKLRQNLDPKTSPLIDKALAQETAPNIKQILQEVKTILIAKYSEGTEQLNAIKDLGASLSPKALQTLNEIKTPLEEDELTTTDIYTTTEQSIKLIERKKSFYSNIEKIFFGLSLGSILFLAAIGLVITFGVMKVINMAHGELIMIGAYTTYVVQQLLPGMMEYSIIIAIPLAFLVSGAVGILIERLIIRHLYNRPLETLLATFGISLILQQVVRSIFSPLNQEVQSPQWMSGVWQINPILSFTHNRMYIILFAILVFLFVTFILKKTSLGIKVRAVSQNREMAKAMGIRAPFIDAITFGIGSGIAGMTGVALSQVTNVGPNLGQSYIVDSFMVVVFGGVGNIWGTLIAALTLGEMNKFLEPVAGAILAKVIILIMIILFMQKKPRGLFPKKGRDAED